jgi:hypothetical protein
MHSVHDFNFTKRVWRLKTTLRAKAGPSRDRPRMEGWTKSRYGGSLHTRDLISGTAETIRLCPLSHNSPCCVGISVASGWHACRSRTKPLSLKFEAQHRQGNAHGADERISVSSGDLVRRRSRSCLSYTADRGRFRACREHGLLLDPCRPRPGCRSPASGEPGFGEALARRRGSQISLLRSLLRDRVGP